MVFPLREVIMKEIQVEVERPLKSELFIGFYSKDRCNSVSLIGVGGRNFA